MEWSWLVVGRWLRKEEVTTARERELDQRRKKKALSLVIKGNRLKHTHMYQGS